MRIGRRTKRLLNTAYVRSAPNWARLVTGHVVLKDIDLSSLDLLAAAPPNQLRDPTFLEDHVLPALGLSDENPLVFPPFLRNAIGRGLRSWQYPNQFGEYLAHVSRYPVESYLEIGMEHGGSFVTTVEYLDRFHPLRRAIGVDLVIAPGLRRFAVQRSNVELVRVDSGSRRFRRFLERRSPIDLVLIDGDHSHEGCERDLQTVISHANAIALHDIADSASPGVSAVWTDAKERFREQFNFFEFVRQYPEIAAQTQRTFLGIGLAVRKTYDVGPRMPQRSP